ncbi:MAG: hypothetical protein NTY77_06665 [Elusimicrobia bacterium]|nr:hypothetical protein [Elusimicrobiota bacterium]
MKKRMLLASLLASLVLAGQAFAQKPPQRPGPEPGAGEEHGKPGLEERNPAVEKEAMEYLKKQIPEIDEELERMQRDKPEVFHQRFRQYMFAYRDPKLRDEFIKGIKSDFEVRRLVQAVRQAKGDDKEKLKKDLEKALSEQFDTNLARMEFKLKRMQEEIGELKTRIDKRRSVKDQIVKKRLGELTGEVETWDW